MLDLQGRGNGTSFAGGRGLCPSSRPRGQSSRDDHDATHCYQLPGGGRGSGSPRRRGRRSSGPASWIVSRHGVAGARRAVLLERRGIILLGREWHRRALREASFEGPGSRRPGSQAPHLACSAPPAPAPGASARSGRAVVREWRHDGLQVGGGLVELAGLDQRARRGELRLVDVRGLGSRAAGSTRARAPVRCRPAESSAVRCELALASRATSSVWPCHQRQPPMQAAPMATPAMIHGPFSRTSGDQPFQLFFFRQVIVHETSSCNLYPLARSQPQQSCLDPPAARRRALALTRSPARKGFIPTTPRASSSSPMMSASAAPLGRPGETAP